MRKAVSLAGVLLLSAASAGVAVADLTFAPAPGYTASEVWSGSYGAHFAVEDGNYYIYGAEPIGGGQLQNVVRLYDGGATTEIARSPAYAENDYFPDAITVLNGEVYWVHAQSFQSGLAANLYKTTFSGSAWTTTELINESAGTNIFGLSTNGTNVFGTGVSNAATNVAFYLDNSDAYNVLANIPADGSGGCGFDPAGDFFGGAWSVGGDYSSHTYEFSAQQIIDRLDGTQPDPYAAADAIHDHLVPSNASAVMECDGASLFGAEYNATWSGTNPYAMGLAGGVSSTLGTLSGADTTVSTDLYYRDAAVYFMGKDDWTTGGQAVIYELVPEPTAALGLLTMALVTLRRRRR